MQKANTSSGFSSLVVLLMLALKYICGESHTHIIRPNDTHVAGCNAFLWSGNAMASHTSTQVGAQYGQDFSREQKHVATVQNIRTVLER